VRIAAIVKIVAEILPTSLDDIVVSPDHIETLGDVELPKEQENVLMRLQNPSEAAVFPQFVRVADLNVSVACSVVVLQSVHIEALVRIEIVCGTSVASVAVAHEDDS
jgi:hypothetical protein